MGKKKKNQFDTQLPWTPLAEFKALVSFSSPPYGPFAPTGWIDESNGNRSFSLLPGINYLRTKFRSIFFLFLQTSHVRYCCSWFFFLDYNVPNKSAPLDAGPRPSFLTIPRRYRIICAICFFSCPRCSLCLSLILLRTLINSELSF